MRTFRTISLLILIVQSFLCQASFAMDVEEVCDNQDILFSAHQRIFHAKLEKLKGSITYFPSVFLSYSRSDAGHTSFVETLSNDLTISGLDVLSLRPGGKEDIHQHSDKILTAKKVILVGSSSLKQEYRSTTGTNISAEINNIRKRVSDRGPIGIIFAWFGGEKGENYPEGIQHLPDRYLGIGSAYFKNFFELLMDIFHTEDKGELIVQDIKGKQQSFIRQRDISKEMLEHYGALQLEHLQAVEAQDREELAEILGLNEVGKANRKRKSQQHQLFSKEEGFEERLTNYQSAVIQQRRVYSLVQEIKDVLKAEPDVPLNVYQAFYQRGLMGEIESGIIELKDAWGMIKANLLFDVESLVERDDLESFLNTPQQASLKEEDIQQSYFSKIRSHLDHIETFERALRSPRQALSVALVKTREWILEKAIQLKQFYQEYLTKATQLAIKTIQQPSLKGDLLEFISEKAIMTGDILMRSEERFYRVSRRVARTVVSVNQRGEPIKKEQGSSVSNHAVSSLPKDNPRLYFKAFSSRVGLKPGHEFMMGSLYDLLNISYPETGVLLFTNLTHNNNPPSIVMVSEGIPGKTGKQVLKERPEFFESLDQEAYEKQVLGAMLTDHGDGKADNFICLENPKRLIPIDNEEVFVPILSEDKKGLRIKSILFTLPQMEVSLSSYQRSYLQSLTPDWISYMWVTAMERGNQAYHQLEQALSLQMLKQQYQTVNRGIYGTSPQEAIYSHYQHLQPILTRGQPLENHSYLFPRTFYMERNRPSSLLSILSLPLQVTGDRIKNIRGRLKRIQTVLNDRKDVNLQDLLDGVNPLVGAYYQKLRDKKRDTNTQKINIKGALRFIYGLEDNPHESQIEAFLGSKTSIKISPTVGKSDDRLQGKMSEKARDLLQLKEGLMLSLKISKIADELILKALTYLRDGYFPVHSHIRDLECLNEEGFDLEREDGDYCLRDLWVRGRDILTHAQDEPLSLSWNETFQSLGTLRPSLDWLMTVEENFIPIENRDLQPLTPHPFLIEGGWMGKRILLSTIAQEILDEKGLLKKDETLSGRSVVRGYPKEKPLFYFKAYPEFPGYEYGTTSFMRRLGIKGLPYTDLMIFRPGEREVNTARTSYQASSSTPSISTATGSQIQNAYPVLLTQAIEGDILKRHWDKPLSKLDFEHTSRLIIASMLINPEDGKEDNFILSPDGRYLIPIDNDHVFLPGATRTLEGIFSSRINTTLQGKTILYCLDEMKRPLSLETVEYIKNINVDLFLRGWFEDLVKVNEKYQSLVNHETLGHFFKERGTVLRIPLDPTFINNLYWKFHHLQGIITHQPALPLIEILKRIEPYMGKRYGDVLSSSSKTLEDRFKFVTKSLYPTDVRGNHISVLNSRQMMEISQISESEATGKANTIKQGPAAALVQLDALRTESQKQEWKAYLEHGVEPRAIDGNKSGEEQAYIDSLMKSPIPPEILAIHGSQRLYSTGFLFSRDQLTPLLDHDKGTRLKLIDLRNSNYIDTKAVQIISSLAPNLAVLNLSGCGYLYNIQGTNERELLEFRSLKRFIINQCSQLSTLFIKAPILNLIEASNNPLLQNLFMETPQLMEFKLGVNNIKDEGLKAFMSILAQTRDNKLLSGNSWQEKILSLFMHSGEQITELQLGGSNIGADGVKVLTAVLPQTKITHLHLNSINIGDEGVKELTAVLPQTKITYLYLNRNNIGADGVKVLVAILPHTKITGLHLDDNKVGADGIKALTAVLPQTQITDLHLDNNNIGAVGVKVLVAVLPQTKITWLYLNGNNIGDEGVKELTAVLPQTKIRYLYLNRNNIGADGVKALAAALPQTQITWLHLGGNKIGSDGIKALTAVLPQTQITWLYLNDNKIGADGVKALAAALPQTQITWLYLNGNKIGADGVKALAAALPQTQITWLHLGGNNIGADGVKALVAILPQTKITWLGLSKNNIGSNDKALLEKINSKKKVYIFF